MSDTQAKNVGAVITNATAPIYQTNIFDGEKPRPLPSNIPSVKGFVGRETELNDLREAKRAGKTSFVLHGQGGVGKTELALQFSNELKPEFQAHIRVDMRGLEESPLTPNDAMLEIVRMFDPAVRSDLSQQEIQNLYHQFLNQFGTLVFLDNAKDRAQAEPLNHANALVVITSRTTFNVSGGFHKEVEQMLPEDARALLHSVAGEERFAGNADALASLAGYLPMALLPLASMLSEDPTLEIADLNKRYEDRRALLSLGDPNRGDLSVAASFDLSYGRLSDQLKACFLSLAVFPSDFDLEALEYVWQREDAREIRSELVKSHLLIFDPETKRSRLHDLARDYAWEKIEPPTLFRAKILHAGYYGIVLGSHDSVSLENLAVFDLERININAGFSFLRDRVDDKGFAQLCTFYTGYASDLFFLRMSLEEIFDWQNVGLQAYTKLEDLKGQAYSLNNLGRVLALNGQDKGAIEYYEEALKIVREIGEKYLEAAWLGNLGNVYSRMENHKEAARYFEQAIQVSVEIGGKASEGRHYGLLGGAYFGLNDFDKAVFYLEKALSFAEIDIKVRAGFAANLGTVYAAKGERAKAIELTREALGMFEKMDAPETEGLIKNLAILEGDSEYHVDWRR